MKDITVQGKRFSLSISEVRIQETVKRIAHRLNEDFVDASPLFLVVLNGAFMFASDLLKQVHVDCDISFIKYRSYEGTQSTGELRELIGLRENITGRKVIIVEDIVDTGHTIQHISNLLTAQQPKSLHIVSLLFKKEMYTASLGIDYVGLEVPNKFLIGYGLDFDGKARNLKDIYELSEQ